MLTTVAAVASFQLKGSVLLIVWPQMAVCAGIAVFATIMRAWVGAEDYLIKDVKGHATLGTALAFLNVFRSNLSYLLRPRYLSVSVSASVSVSLSRRYTYIPWPGTDGIGTGGDSSESWSNPAVN